MSASRLRLVRGKVTRFREKHAVSSVVGSLSRSITLQHTHFILETGTMDYSLQNHRSFIGSKATDLPTPSFVLSLPTIKKNIERLHQDVEKAGVTLRPHVKTLKVGN